MIKSTALYATLVVGLASTSCTKCSKDEAKAPEVATGQVAGTPVVDVTELKIETLKPGSGTVVAAAGKKVSIHYTGTLTDGTVIDSSEARKTPLPFTLGAGQVIPGWEKGIEGMKIGERRRLTIPSKLGYGEKGIGNVVPPNATLIFEVELMSVE